MTVFPSTATIKDHLGDFDSLEAEWRQVLSGSPASHLFFTPEWGCSWWQHLSSGEPHLLSIQQGSSVVGIAPLVKQRDTLTLLGDKEVCDYLDFIALPGAEGLVARSILDFANGNACLLDLYPLLSDSLTLSYLAPLAKERCYTVHTEVLDVSYGMPLPASWEEYMDGLHGKNRHELRRKLRRLERFGKVNIYASQSIARDMDDFLRLFRISRPDKDRFMTPQREAFFRQISQELGQRGWLRLYFMEVDSKRLATALCFDYGDTMYLYNSGFEPAYADLSVGLICKALTIREAIAQGKKIYDFLRGAEDYKSDLGGKPTSVYRCTIITQPGVPGICGETPQ